MIAPLLTMDDCSKILCVTSGALRTIIYEKTAPPHIKLGRNVRFHEDDVKRWIDQKRGIQTPALGSISNDNADVKRKRGRPREAPKLGRVA